MNASLPIAAVVYAVFSMPVLAQSGPLVERYMERSGLVSLVARVDGKMQVAIDRALAQPSAPKLNAEQLDRLRGAVKVAYDADRLRESLQSNLMAQLPGGDTERFVSWLDTPFGKRVTAVESMATTPEGQRRAAELVANTYDETSVERKSILDRLAKKSGLVDLAVILALEQEIGVAQGMAALTGTDYRGPWRESDKSEQRRKQTDAAAKAWVMNAAVVYAPLSDDELGQYVAVLERASMQRVLEATGRALEKTLTGAVTELLRQLASAAAKPTN
ncbi:MAG TPA: hypothetical protein VFO33_05915 [Casimicrobiaceae bacterium]|nr:hypothetical protein [Casimicrobiaceae bacterium]